MSLFRIEDHAANPPDTWLVAKSGRRWKLTSKDGVVIGGFDTKRAAEAARTSGWAVTLYEKERRWYAGEPVHGWRMYADVVASR